MLCALLYFLVHSSKSVLVLVIVCTLVNWQTNYEYATLQSVVYYAASN